VRYGGREKGVKNKLTIQREQEAAQRVAAARGPKAKEAALSVLERLMQVAEGATALHRPPGPKEVEAAAASGQSLPKGDWGLFGDWWDRAAYAAKELAKYQAPQIKSVDAPAPPPDPDEVDRGSRRRFGLRVFEGGRPLGQTDDAA
jgi:hypothetical protein